MLPLPSATHLVSTRRGAGGLLLTSLPSQMTPAPHFSYSCHSENHRLLNVKHILKYVCLNFLHISSVVICSGVHLFIYLFLIQLGELNNLVFFSFFFGLFTREFLLVTPGNWHFTNA